MFQSLCNTSISFLPSSMQNKILMLYLSLPSCSKCRFDDLDFFSDLNRPAGSFLSAATNTSFQKIPPPSSCCLHNSLGDILFSFIKNTAFSSKLLNQTV